MKTIKKILSVAVSLMMVFSLMTVVNAANYTITAPENDHTYNIYQIFTGDLSGGKLTNIALGANGQLPEETTLEAALTELSNVDASGTDRAKLKVIEKYWDSTSAAVATAKKDVPASVPGGYYLIEDVVTDGTTPSVHMVKVVGDITITPKTTGTPEFDKFVQDINDSDENPELTGWQKSADWDIGDLVPFKLEAKLPTGYDNYKSYYLRFNDTLSLGLKLQASTVVVKVDGVELADEEYYIYGDQNDFQVVIYNLKDATTTAHDGSVVTVEYSALLTTGAVIGSTGNPNTATLTFTNNPNQTGIGKPDDTHTPGTPENPDDDKPENDTPETPDQPENPGTSPEKEAIVFTYQVIVNKVDEGGDPLKGASFTLSKKVNGEWKVVGTLVAEAVMEGEEVKSYTANFKGLDDGDYKLEETVTPDGYNRIDAIEFTISATHKSDELTLTELSGGALGTGVVETGAITTNIENKQGSTLPSTGGMGTTMLYVGGSILMLGAAILLVSKKRMEA